jgi:enamine deaminase RidA (YjgF/YER057c/UK114 family)
MGSTRESKLADIGIQLLPAPRPVGTYVSFLLVGDLLYVSGQGPLMNDGSFATGTLGKDLTTEQGYEHAKLAGAAVLSVVKSEVRLLANVNRVIKVFGMVNSTPEFKEHPEVINGCSDLFMHVFGDHGKHVRSAVGMSSLPRGISVEIEAVFQIEPGSTVTA